MKVSCLFLAPLLGLVATLPFKEEVPEEISADGTGADKLSANANIDRKVKRDESLDRYALHSLNEAQTENDNFKRQADGLISDLDFADKMVNADNQDNRVRADHFDESIENEGQSRVARLSAFTDTKSDSLESINSGNILPTHGKSESSKTHPSYDNLDTNPEGYAPSTEVYDVSFEDYVTDSKNTPYFNNDNLLDMEGKHQDAETSRLDDSVNDNHEDGSPVSKGFNDELDTNINYNHDESKSDNYPEDDTPDTHIVDESLDNDDSIKVDAFDGALDTIEKEEVEEVEEEEEEEGEEKKEEDQDSEVPVLEEDLGDNHLVGSYDSKDYSNNRYEDVKNVIRPPDSSYDNLAGDFEEYPLHTHVVNEGRNEDLTHEKLKVSMSDDRLDFNNKDEDSKTPVFKDNPEFSQKTENLELEDFDDTDTTDVEKEEFGYDVLDDQSNNHLIEDASDHNVEYDKATLHKDNLSANQKDDSFESVISEDFKSASDDDTYKTHLDDEGQNSDIKPEGNNLKQKELKRMASYAATENSEMENDNLDTNHEHESFDGSIEEEPFDPDESNEDLDTNLEDDDIANNALYEDIIRRTKAGIFLDDPDDARPVQERSSDSEDEYLTKEIKRERIEKEIEDERLRDEIDYENFEKELEPLRENLDNEGELAEEHDERRRLGKGTDPVDSRTNDKYIGRARNSNSDEHEEDPTDADYKDARTDKKSKDDEVTAHDSYKKKFSDGENEGKDQNVKAGDIKDGSNFDKDKVSLDMNLAECRQKFDNCIQRRDHDPDDCVVDFKLCKSEVEIDK